MGNICDCLRRRRHNIRYTNIPPATETTPPLIFAAATPYSNPNPNQFYQYPSQWDHCPSPPKTIPPPPYDHHHYPPQPPHPWIPGEGFPIMPPPFVEHQKAVTIKNDVNLIKKTLRLEPDPINPGRVLVSFTFDATFPGRITIVFFGKECEEGNLIATKEDTLPSITFDFDKGLGQKFIQPSGTGLDLSVFKDSELFEETKTGVYPLMVKAEATPVVGHVNVQITQAVYVKEKGEVKIGDVKQILWVNGLRYELQDIYGIGNDTVDGCDEDDASDDPGKECVICLSEPGDTTVLPCRHMCMCSGCAKLIRFQTNLCPVCRQPVEKLLEIAVNLRNEGNGDRNEHS